MTGLDFIIKREMGKVAAIWKKGYLEDRCTRPCNETYLHVQQEIERAWKGPDYASLIELASSCAHRFPFLSGEDVYAQANAEFRMKDTIWEARKTFYGMWSRIAKDMVSTLLVRPRIVREVPGFDVIKDDDALLYVDEPMARLRLVDGSGHAWGIPGMPRTPRRHYAARFDNSGKMQTPTPLRVTSIGDQVHPAHPIYYAGKLIEEVGR